MKYIITGSTGHISKPLSGLLVEAGHDVAIISSDHGKISEIEHMGAKAIIGSVEDAAFLTKSFEGADGIYTMIPPKMDAVNWKEFIYHVSDNYLKAIRANKVNRVVNLSSMGAHIKNGGGLLSLYNHAEQNINTLDGVHVTHLRPGSFYTNFFGSIGMIKQMGIIGNNYGDRILALVHPDDIAVAAFEELTATEFVARKVRYVVSDERSTDEIAKVLGESISKPDLKWVRFKDEDAVNGMLQAGISKDVAANLMEMGKAVASGEATSDYNKQAAKLSPKKLEDFSLEFAFAFANA